MPTTDPTTPAVKGDRYRSELGDRRERPVQCQRCASSTYAFDRLCDRCFVNVLDVGDELVITATNAGVILNADDHRFAGTVAAGTLGRYAGRHPNAALADWLLVEVDAGYVATPDAEVIPTPTALAPLRPSHVGRR